MENFTALGIPALPPGTHFDGKTPGFGIRVGKNRKTWFVLQGAREKRTQTILGYFPALTLSEARQKAYKALGGPFHPLTVPTYPEALKEFLAQEKWRPKPRIVIEQSLRKHFPWTATLTKITHQDVLAALEKVPTAGARSHALKDIRTFFNWCVPRHLSQSPAAGIKMPTYVPRARVLTDDELKRVWIASEQCGTFGVIVRLLILTGQRRGEIAALQPAWIQNPNPILKHSSTESLQASSYLPSSTSSNIWTITLPAEITKNEREHTFPLGPLSSSLLDRSSSSTSVLFSARGSAGNKGFNGWSKSKAKLDRLCGVEDWTLHDLRRTFATGLASLGVPIHVTEKLLNHVSGTMGGIISVYQKHQYWPEQVEAMQAWEAKVLSLVR